MTISALPAAPLATDNESVFDPKAYAFVAALDTFRTETNAESAAMQLKADMVSSLLLGMALPGYAATSSTSLTIGTGSKSLTVQSGKSYIAGQPVVISADSSNYMKGTITSYSGTTLVVSVTAAAGSGTYTSWSVGLSYLSLNIAASGVNSDIIKLTGITDYTGSLALRGYISGLTMSTAGASSTMTVAAGVAMDSANAMLMQLASSLSKTTASWAVGTGNGGLDTGTIANSTWYHWYLIRRPDTGVVDVVFSTSASAPTLPTNYTQYRRIGSGKTNGSGQWILFQQNGDSFVWDAPVIDLDAVNQGAAAVTRTLTVPTGVVVDALLTVGGYYASTPFGILISPLSVADTAPQAIGTAALTAPATSSSMNSTAGWNFSPLQVTTNTSAQVRTRTSGTGASDRLGLITRGWIDTRGR